MSDMQFEFLMMKLNEIKNVGGCLLLILIAMVLAFGLYFVGAK
jgi:hypothetical protein